MTLSVYISQTPLIWETEPYHNKYILLHERDQVACPLSDDGKSLGPNVRALGNKKLNWTRHQSGNYP